MGGALNAQSWARPPILGASFLSPIRAGGCICSQRLPILHRAHCKSPIKPALQRSPRLLELHDQRGCGPISHVLFMPRYVGRMYQLSTEYWQGWEDRAVMRGRKPFHSRAGLGIKEHPAQLPHPPASACTPLMIQNHLLVGLWCPYWHECK